MWNLSMPDLSHLRAHLDLIFPDEDLLSPLKPADKDKLMELYVLYQQGLGKPNPEWIAEGLSEDAQEAILKAYGEVSETGRLAVLRASLKNLAKVCPYCGFGEVRDLDHHLQKKIYKCFSIFPLNLVPSCSKCNGHKPRKPRKKSTHQHINAYLEDLSFCEFFVADIDISGGAVLATFKIEKQKGMSDETLQRLKQHLKDFKLYERYPSQVNIFLASQQVALDDNFRAGGAEGVKAFLMRSAAANVKSLGINDWRGALFVGLAKNDEFCDGGFYKALGFPPP